jgi:hypothetical protein
MVTAHRVRGLQLSRDHETVVAERLAGKEIPLQLGSHGEARAAPDLPVPVRVAIGRPQRDGQLGGDGGELLHDLALRRERRLDHQYAEPVAPDTQREVHAHRTGRCGVDDRSLAPEATLGERTAAGRRGIEHGP